MLSIGFSRIKCDSCVYLQCLDDGSFIYLLLYVDDMLIAVMTQNSQAPKKYIIGPPS